MTTDDRAERWMRQAGESARSYANFCVYRDLGSERTLAQAARRLKKAVTTLRKQSAEWLWTERAICYDDWEKENQLRVEAGDFDSMIQRHTNLAKLLQSKFYRRFSNMTDEEVMRLPVGAAVYCLDFAVRMENAAREAKKRAGGSGIKVGFLIHAPDNLIVPDDPTLPPKPNAPATRD